MQRQRANVINRIMSSLWIGVLYGSSRDGTWLPTYNADTGKYEVDGDLLLPVSFLSEEEQKQYIKYREGTPGFVYIDLTDIENSELEQKFEHANVKERGGRKYLSAVKVKKSVLDFTYLVESNDQRFVNFKAMMCPLSLDPSSASSEMIFTGGSEGTFNLHGDLVQCIACSNWPVRAYSWCERPRHWPPGYLVEEITNSVFHLVSKPSSPKDVEIEWRLSFSFAEYKLIEAITGPKLTTYMILKNLITEIKKKQESYINENGEKENDAVLKTYHLKTVFFWACEEQTADFWNSEEIDKCVFSVLDLLIDWFMRASIPHYFIPEINLLMDIKEDALQNTVKELKQIRRDIQIERKTQKPNIEAITLMEMASMKVQYDLDTEQLEKKETNPLSDMSFVVLSLIRECSSCISDYASMACHSAHNGLINETQLWDIEEILSCCYAMLSACEDQVNILIKICKDEHLRMAEIFEKLSEYLNQPHMLKEFAMKYKNEPEMLGELVETVLKYKDQPKMIEKVLMTYKDQPEMIADFIRNYKDQPQMIEELVRKYKDQPLIEALVTFADQLEPDEDPDESEEEQSDPIKKSIVDIEFPHGHYEQQYLSEFSYLTYVGMVLKLALALAELTINKKLEYLLNKIILSDSWNLNMLTDVLKPVLPDFKWSEQGHLNVHQLAQDAVWMFDIPFDALLKKKDNLSQSPYGCQGNCWEKRLNQSKEILFASNPIPNFTIYEVSFRGQSSVYAEGQKLEKLESLLLSKKGKETTKKKEC